jgi:hypothetical protein
MRAGIAAHPGAYAWSSYRANALGEDDDLVTPHPHYYSLGRSPEERRAAYTALFAQWKAPRRFNPASGSPASRSRRIGRSVS